MPSPTIQPSTSWLTQPAAAWHGSSSPNHYGEDSLLSSSKWLALLLQEEEENLILLYLQFGKENYRQGWEERTGWTGTGTPGGGGSAAAPAAAPANLLCLTLSLQALPYACLPTCGTIYICYFFPMLIYTPNCCHCTLSCCLGVGGGGRGEYCLTCMEVGSSTPFLLYCSTICLGRMQDM